MSEEQCAYVEVDTSIEYPQQNGVFPLVVRETGKRIGTATVRRQDYFGIPTFYQAWFTYFDTEDAP